MIYSVWTIVSTLFLTFICKSSAKTQDLQTSSATHPVDEIELLKEHMRDMVTKSRTVYNSLPDLNAAIESKRRQRRELRTQLRQLERESNAINNQDTHTQRFASGDSAKIGVYNFALNMAQPTDHTKETKITNATLILTRKPISPQAYTSGSLSASQRMNVGFNTVLSVYQILPDNMRRLISSKMISLASNSTIRLNVTEIVQSWIAEPGMNNGIEIESTTHNLSQFLTTQTPEESNAHLDIVSYQQNITMQSSCSSSKKCCQRKAIQIKYEDIGLRNPYVNETHSEQYMKAYVCNGRCSKDHMLHNYWSVIKYKLRKKYSDTNTKHLYKSRCSPVAFEPFTHYQLNDEGSEVQIHIDNLLVKECACV